MTLLLLLAVPALAMLPAIGRATVQAASRHHQTVSKKKGKPKPKEYTKATRTASRKHKTSKSKSKSKARPKPTPRKTVKKPVKKKTPAPKPAATSKPAPARTPTPTNTPTATPTPTDTPTATPTPLPTPDVTELQVAVHAARGYRAWMVACGLPSGVAANFVTNPVVFQYDASAAEGGSANPTMNVVVPYTAPAGEYLLALHPYFQDGSGNAVPYPSTGFSVSPRSVLLTIDGSGHATLAASDAVAAVGNQGCSALPPGYLPTPQATTLPNIVISSSVSDPHPVPGEAETITGTITVGGNPVVGQLMRTNWFFPQGAIYSCNATTDSTGTASCSVPNTYPVPGFTVQIEVIFDYDGQQYITYSSYLM